MSTVQYDSNGNIINSQDASINQLADATGTTINPTKEDGKISLLEGKVPFGLTTKAASTAAVASDQALVVAISPNNSINASLTNSSIEVSNDVGNPIPVNGTVTANLGTIAGVSTETTLSALNTKVPSNLTVSSTRLLVDNSGVTQPVSASALPLPTGASTSSLQTTGNTSLSNIDTKTPALGQTTMASSSPVAIASNQTAIPVTGTFFQTTQPVSASSLPLPTGAATETTLNTLLKPASTLAAVTTVSAVTAITNALPTGTNSIGQVTANAGTNLNTSALNLETTQSAMSAKFPAVLGARTIAQSMGVNIASDQVVPVSATSLPLPTGASTSALQTTGNASLSSIDTNQTNGTARTQITDGTNNADVINTNPAASTQALVVRAMPYRPATHTVTGTQIVLGNQKSLLAIQNTGTSVIRISRIYLVNTTVAAVTGVVANIRLQRIASFTGGTALSSFPHNTTNALAAGITFATGSTVTSESALFRDSFWSSDEWAPGTSDVEAIDHTFQELTPWYKVDGIEDGITLIQNQGLHVKCNTNTTVGNFTITVVFTVEDV